MMHMLADTNVPTVGSAYSAERMRDLYRQESEDGRKQVTRRGLWIAVFAYVAYSVTDLLFVPDVAAHTIVGRVIVGITSLCLLELLLRLKASADLLDVNAALAVLAGYVVWLLTAEKTIYAEAFTYYMAFGAIFMMSVNLFFSFRFRLAVASSATNLLIFISALHFFEPMLLLHKLILGAFCISCFIFTAYVNLELNRERYKVFLNAFEARLQQEAAEERGRALLHLSHTDSLTGLENRRAVDQRLRSHWQDWQTYQRGFAVLLVDVDFFKRYNDFYGHQEGDRCLIAVAQGLDQATAARGAAIGRYGGEEFIVIAPIDNPEQFIRLADDLCASVQAMALPHEYRRDGTSVVTVSVGVSYTRGQTKQLEKIVHEADRALYAAKANGRNCVMVFDPEDPQTGDESENIAAILRIALEQRLVSLVYQPICNVQTGALDGAEALMRMKMPDGTPVTPNTFIPVAERTGAIVELGRWAIRTVCEELLATNRVQVASVNVSPTELKMPGFAAYVAATLAEHGLIGTRLAFEITEGVELEVDTEVFRCISELKRLGVQIWLDDFGTGFAGLSWLRMIEFDTVKIDRSFLHDCAEERGRVLLRDIISLLRHRGLRILVEGVETEEHEDLMRAYGIDQIQGYHVGRPAPAARFAMVDRFRSAAAVGLSSA